MSSSNCCFLTCIQISQEAGQVVWYSHLFQNFPQFIVIHTVKGFGIVNKAEIDIYLELSCFFVDPADVGNLISGSSAFSKTSLNILCALVLHCSVGVRLFVTPWAVTCLASLSMGILQTRILEWVAMPSSRESSQHRDRTHISCIAGGFFTVWASREALSLFSQLIIYKI